MCDNRCTTPDAQAISLQVAALVSTAPDGPDVGLETAKILDAATVNGILDGARALELAARRASGVPIPHLLGHTMFMGLELMCAPGVFAAREETELLGWTTIERLRRETPSGQGLRLIDVGAGLGG
jgi:methylase of polypeptide subunit release factors